MQVGTGRSILNGIAIGKLKIYKEKGHRDLHRRDRRHRCRGRPVFEAAQQKAIEQQTAL